MHNNQNIINLNANFVFKCINTILLFSTSKNESRAANLDKYQYILNRNVNSESI